LISGMLAAVVLLLHSSITRQRCAAEHCRAGRMEHREKGFMLITKARVVAVGFFRFCGGCLSGALESTGRESVCRSVCAGV
jgi:hypothetical protein